MSKTVIPTVAELSEQSGGTCLSELRNGYPTSRRRCEKWDHQTQTQRSNEERT